MNTKHGKVVEYIVTECAHIFIHEDGYREVIFDEDMEVQEAYVLE